jgi:hypothetical protein
METDPDKLDDLRSAEDTSRLLEEHREAIRNLFSTTALAGLTVQTLAGPAGAASPSGAAPRITVYRDSGCGCCEGWASAVKAAGYSVDVKELEHTARLRRFSIPLELAGCHTAVTGGYLIEGHVPLEALAQLLRERPPIRGIALPGMPSGTPGMPGAHTTTRVVVLDAPHRVYYTS